MFALDARIFGSLIWMLRGKMIPRNWSEPASSPDPSIASIPWGEIFLEPPFELTWYCSVWDDKHAGSVFFLGTVFWGGGGEESMVLESAIALTGIFFEILKDLGVGKQDTG